MRYIALSKYIDSHYPNGEIEFMTSIELDYRLEQDCIRLGTIDDNLLLLMNNSLIPWLIIVPSDTLDNSLDNSTDNVIVEFDLLPTEQQIDLLKQINQLSAFLRKYFPIDKINIGSIGNVVSQLHLHIVGRSTKDYCWPDVVWGNNKQLPWEEQRLTELIEKLESFIPDSFQKHQ
ncbi:MAG: diadenosine tetraphosphate (Ap4A) HIT family hydrolase [Enterobacterales bacterium]|jgi:diadenosine tetraphosphate (Ap4A) HIT family hydrolase